MQKFPAGNPYDDTEVLLFANNLLPQGEKLPHSRMTGYVFKQLRHSAPDSLFHFENLLLQPSKLKARKHDPKHYQYAKGALKGRCTRERNLFADRKNFPLSHGELFSSLESSSGDEICSVYIDFPVLFITRVEYKNLYFQLGDAVNAYMTRSILRYSEIDFENIEIVFQDHWPAFDNYSPLFTPISTHMASTGNSPDEKKSRRIRNLNDFVKEYSGRSINEVSVNFTLCFRHALYNIPGYGSFLVKDRFSGGECFASDVLMGYSRFIINYFGLDDVAPQKGGTISILLVSRRHYDKRRISRTISNEGELINGLNSAYGNDTIHTVDFAGLSFLDQISVVRKSNIMVGMHGAGMAHSIWLPREAVVMEMFPKNFKRETFRNIAKLGGHPYLTYRHTRKDYQSSESGSTRIDVDEIVSSLKGVVRITGNTWNGIR